MRSHLRLALMLTWISTIGLAGEPAVAQAPIGDGRGGAAPGPSEMGDPVAPGGRGDRGACSRTSTAALRACRNEVYDDYWIEFGKCLNLADEGERQQCMEEAEEALGEAESLCREQYDAREEVCEQLGQDPYDPQIDPANFLSPGQAAANPNPYFPLVPGTIWRYEEGSQVIDVAVTNETKEILGVTCFEVRDVVRENGEVIEDTQDWYALDVDGNLWYMGEHSETFEGGELVSLEGSWTAGVDGGKAGIIMEASPKVEDVYRQEFLLGDAEDVGEVISITGTATVPAASCNGDCVVTRDFSPLEPGSEAHKYYALNVGSILEVDPETGDRVELVMFTPGAPLYPGGTIPTAARSTALLSQVRVVGQAGMPGSGAESAIQFDLAHDADVNVDVYDPAGRRVQSVFTGRRGAGSHTFQWQGTDRNGQRVANGVYFVRVRAGAESRTGRVAILAR